ncbi:hypothetical protein CPB84DRAFT_1678813 [Gymnopilus junonius]|uniref:Calcium uniporter protein, mitochondrial n=1 Tax=Gymnopilus junonius TaxID=109634 RepID=A0A9P5NQ60_GYMJU|nr:hypothetical protein CPB84DRAFT_1678813 [Gymnopilus junonius]
MLRLPGLVRLHTHRRPTTRLILLRDYSAPSRSSLNVSHSQFLSEASPRSRWKDEHSGNGSQKTGNFLEEDEMFRVTDSRGKLSSTSSHLFKLVLPLSGISHSYRKSMKDPSKTIDADADVNNPNTPPSAPPTVLLLHPSQPLSHVSRLILASLSPATPAISFRSVSPEGRRAFQWSDSTDFGDFIKDAARSAEFKICISYGPETDSNTPTSSGLEDQDKPKDDRTEKYITVSVPTFADRTRFMTHRLNLAEQRIRDIEGLKALCDAEAHRGARKMALGGFGMLVVYWAGVARLTFWDYGWDIMEPITYLSGLSTVILGYLWFLYQGREVSYTSVLARSISARREALYKAQGFDIERWIELVNE